MSSWVPNTPGYHEEHQVKPAARLRAPLLRLAALPGHERDRVPSKKPPLPMDGAQPGLSQSESNPHRAIPRGHAADLHRRFSQERHHTDARHAGRPQRRAVRGRDPSDPSPPGHAGHLESLGQGEDPTGRGGRHGPGAGFSRASVPARGELSPKHTLHNQVFRWTDAEGSLLCY